MPLLLSCQSSIPLLDLLEEGALPLSQALQVHLHLLGCRPCRIIRRELQALPRLCRAPPSAEDLRQGEAALARAMERLKVPQPPPGAS